LTAAAAAPGEIALEAKGYIVPRQQILVSPKVSGMILTLDVEEGRRVKKGDVLAVLESTEYEAEAEKANATVALMEQRLLELKNGSRPEEIRQAEAELEEARAELVQLEADWRRSAELRKRNSVTEQEYELAESKYLAQRQTIKRLEAALELWKIGTRKEKLDAAAAEVDQAKAELTKAQWRLGNCTIRSPISGTILKKNAEEGNIVNPIAFNGSFSICELADLADLEVDLNVSERDISAVKVGQKCRIRTDAWPDRVYDGVVSRLMPIADRAKAAVPVRVKIAIPADEQGQYLKPEMGAIVTFLNDKP
jgi:multidrug resistance efflux pump